MTGKDILSSVMNGSMDPATTTSMHLYPYETRIALSSVWILASVFGIVGNSLVIGSVFLSKKVRTVTNAFVINLSVADIWTSLSYPWQVVALLSRGAWPLESEVPCIIAAVQLYTGLAASMYSLAMIALNRFVLVTQTKETYQRWYSTGKVIGMISATWIIPCIVFFLPPVVGVGAFGYDPEDNTCSDKDGHQGGREYNLAQSLGSYPVPMVIIVSSYTALYIHLRRHFRKMQERIVSTAESRNDPAPGTETSVGASTEQAVPESLGDLELESQSGSTLSDRASCNRRAIRRQQLAITKNLFLVFCVFFLLVSPYFISLAIPSSRQFALYGLTICILNSCVNPIIYAVNHPNFKVVLRKMITCRYSEIPEPSDWLRAVLSRRA